MRDSLSKETTTMARFTVKSALASVAVAGVLAAAWMPTTIHAASPQDVPGPSMVQGRPVVYNDPLSPVGQHKTDAQLGETTAWEGDVNLSDPTGAIAWTRKVIGPLGAISSVSSAMKGVAVERMQPAGLAHASRVATLSKSTCDNYGGVKLYHNPDEIGDCLRLTGDGSMSLAGVQYPFSSYYADHSQALTDTQSRTPGGYLSCSGGQWDFGFQQNYTPLVNTSGGRCPENNGKGQGGVYAISIQNAP